MNKENNLFFWTRSPLVTIGFLYSEMEKIRFYPYGDFGLYSSPGTVFTYFTAGNVLTVISVYIIFSDFAIGSLSIFILLSQVMQHSRRKLQRKRMTGAKIRIRTSKSFPSASQKLHFTNWNVQLLAGYGICSCENLTRVYSSLLRWHT